MNAPREVAIRQAVPIPAGRRVWIELSNDIGDGVTRYCFEWVSSTAPPATSAEPAELPGETISSRASSPWGPLVALLTLAAAVCMFATADWVQDAAADRWLDHLRWQQDRALWLVGWMGAWMTVSRLKDGQTRWRAHLGLAATAAVLYGLCKLIVPIAAAALVVSAPRAAEVSGWILVATAFSVPHLRQMQWSIVARRLVTALALSIGIIAAVTHAWAALRDPSQAAPWVSRLPPGLLAETTLPLEDVLASANRLKVVADDARSRPFKDRE